MLKKILRKIYSFFYSLFNKERSINDYHIHPSAFLYHKRNIKLHKSSLICEYCIVRAPLAILEIEENSQIGPHCVILTGRYGIKIGKNVMIAPHCVLAAGNHEFRNLDLPMRFSGDFSNGPIIIEDDVWIGANCTITDNVKIGHGSIIGANSLVNTDIEPFSIAGGIPCKVLSSRLKYKK